MAEVVGIQDMGTTCDVPTHSTRKWSALGFVLSGLVRTGRRAEPLKDLGGTSPGVPEHLGH